MITLASCRASSIAVGLPIPAVEPETRMTGPMTGLLQHKKLLNFSLSGVREKLLLCDENTMQSG
jgi:hypothetical protein